MDVGARITPPKQPILCPHGFHIFALCMWCWHDRKSVNRV